MLSPETRSAASKRKIWQKLLDKALQVINPSHFTAEPCENRTFLRAVTVIFAPQQADVYSRT